MATIEIDTIQKLVDFSTGTYGRGTSSEYLDVVLTADLDFADYPDWAGFTGTWYMHFDGGGHTIRNISYAGTASWAFVYGLSGSIKNVKLLDMYIVAGAASSLTYYLNNGGTTLEKVDVTGDITTTSGIAAVFGVSYQNTFPVIKNCSYDGVVTSPYPYISYHANVIGCNFRGTFDGSSQGDVSLVDAAGGYIVDTNFIGKISVAAIPVFSGTVKFCYAVIKGNAATHYVAANGSALTKVFYDSDVASAAGITVYNATAATTEQLHSLAWLRSEGYAV